MGQLQDLVIRLQRRGLDRFGSLLRLWWLLLKKEESLELHPRSWGAVRLLNVIKVWDDSRQDNLAILLCNYLFANSTAEAHQQQHNLVMGAIVEDLATLTRDVLP